MAATTASRVAAGTVLREGERALLIAAGVVFALASGGAAMTAAAADAMFLAEIGPGSLGLAVALSSALLAAVLAVVGGFADRLERRRVLATLAAGSAVVIAALAALSLVAPGSAAVATFIGGKQLAAATDLAFWVVIAERLDARRSQRLLPMLAATGSLGAAAGAGLVIPLAAALGARGVLVGAALLLAAASVGASRLAPTRRVVAATARAQHAGALIGRAWRDGARAVRRFALARHLALVVAAAGAFGSLAYFALGVAVAARGGKTADFAVLLGAVRGIGQLLTLAMQLALTSRIIARGGTGRALLVAPVAAVLAGLGLVVAPILALAIAAQLSARVLDAGVETPAEKLAQTLLPTAVRGRVGGFLDGTAKRAGAVLGGLLAALLAGAPATFYIAMTAAAAIWLAAAWRLARELPRLAIEHVVHGELGAGDAAVDERAIAALVRELAGPQPERAAEVLARLHERGRVDAVGPLASAVGQAQRPALWRALVAALDRPRAEHAAAIAEAAAAAPPPCRELAIRARGLVGHLGAASAGLVGQIAALRARGEDDAVLAELGDAVRSSGLESRVAIDELVVEITRALAAAAPDRAGAAARHLARALARRRGDAPARVAGFTALARVVASVRERRDAELSLLRADLLELVRERVESAASPAAPPDALVSLVRPRARPAIDESAEVAAALRLYGVLLEGADAASPEDIRRIAQALGEPDDDVRTAAEDALGALGPAAAGELIAVAAWGRRRARDRAAALLADLPVTPAALDALVDAELDALDQTATALAALTAPGDELLARRLDERLREIAHTVLLLVAVRRKSPAIARAADAWRHARGSHERARALAVIEATLPRALVARLVDAVDELTPTDRAAHLARAGGTPPARDVVERAELAGRDRLARALVLHAASAEDRAAHRATIARAAHAEVAAASPHDLLRRIVQRVGEDLDASPAASDDTTEMPTRVETLIALGRVPMLAALSTRQLADVAERARWVDLAPGAVVVAAGEPIDALIVVDDGELELAGRRYASGEVVDELACVAPLAAPADLRVARGARLIRLERADFEELVDDVPGLASAVCRALGERARRAEDAGYRSPLVTRTG